MHDSSITNPAYRSLTDQQLSEIDELCDRFDQELVNGGVPRIEISLAEAPQAARDRLLAELLAMEVEYRTQQGDAPEPEEYLRRFPQQDGVIAGVFAREARTHYRSDSTISIPVNVPPVLANFRLLKEIGRGGMGVVWLADQDKPVKRRVALKLIKSELTSQDVLARFDAEKHALAMMDHPNIARVLDAGATDDGRPYFVMELVDGTPITQYCDDNKLSVDERLKLFVPVCKAVQHAHQKGIVHRDLKPSNVLVTVIDGEAVPKVIDFGLAKAVAQDLHLSNVTMQTEFGKVVGTVQYMSPEQAELKGPDAEDIDTRTDVYSLGVMLYELLTGSTPLDQETLGRNALLKLLQIIREEDPPRPSNRLSSSSHEVNSAVSELRRLHPARLRQLLQGELDWVVMRALEKEPDRRYQTANDLAQDLTNYLTGETVTARPPSTWYQLQKFARRNRGLVATALAIGVVLLAGIAGTSYGLIRASEKTKLAEDKSLEAEDERGKAKASEQAALLEKAKAQFNEQRAVVAETLASAEAQHARDAEAAAKFQLAVARYDAGRASEARSLLHQIPREYRDNFEWHFCNRRFQGSDVTCYGHSEQVSEVAYTPDGKRVVSADQGGTIRLWDAATGQEIGKLEGHEGRVFGLAVSPDGAFIASAGDGAEVRLWDTKSGDIIRMMRGHSDAINCIAFSPSGDRIASASGDKTIALWDTKTGEVLVTFTGHTASVLGVAFSPDGERIASSSDGDQTVRIWDSRTGEQITMVRQGQADTRRLAFSPDGTRLATISYGKYSLWDTQTWQLVEEAAAHNGLVRCVAFSPDGTRFATAGDDTKIKLWETATGRLISTLSGHAQTVWSVAFSPDGSRLVSSGKDRTVKIWDTDGSNDLKLKKHLAACSSVAFSPDGKRFASGGSDGTVILWDSQTSESLFTMQGHVGYVNELSFSPDGNRLASGGDDQTVRLWDTHTGEELAVLKGHTSWVRGVAFSPDGKQVASAGWEGALKLWDAHSHHEIATLTGHRGGLYCVAYSPDASCLASASYDQTVKLWDSQSGQEIRTFQGHTGLVRTLAFGPEGERLVSAGYDPKVRVWDVSSGVQIAAAERSSAAIFGVAFCPDGRRIATICTDAAIHLFDARTGAEIMPLYSGGSSAVTFSPDGSRLVAVGRNGVVRILDARRDHETTILRGHANAVTSVTFSPDGSQIYSESESEKLVWDVATRETIRGATWEPMEVTTHLSPDRRWFVTSEARNVVLVDLEYKNTPYETEWRIAKARFDSLWHQEQATAATTVRNWYAAVFHDAWLVKHDPNQASCYGRLQSSFQKLKSQFEQEGRNLDPHLASVVKEALQHVDEWTNSGFEEPRIRKSTWAFQATIPHWKTTGEIFEIWSSGFQGVTAHDGDQFVELNANEEGTLYQDLPGIERDALLEFSFAHRGRNGEDTLKLTITDLGADNAAGGGDDQELFAKEYTTGNSAWAVYDSTTEPAITALGNKLRFAYTAVYATGGRGPDNTEGNFLDAAEFGVGVVTARREAHGVK